MLNIPSITITTPAFSIPMPKLWLLIFLVVVNLALAYRTWIGNKRHPTNIFFALTALATAVWTLGTLWSHIAVYPILSSILVRIAYLAPVFIAPFFFLFSFHLGYQIFPLKRWYIRALIIGSIVMSIIIIAPNMFLAWPVTPDRHMKPEISLFWHLVFAVYFMTVMLLGFYVLFLKSRKMDGIWKKRAQQCFIATIVAFVGGSAFNLWFALFRDDSLAWLGPVFTIFMAVYIWYHIFRTPKLKPRRA